MGRAGIGRGYEKKATGNTLVCLLIDETGSMGHLRQSVVDGINEYVKSQQDDVNANHVRLTMAMFDSARKHLVFEGIPIRDARRLLLSDYNPGQGTNLYDSVGYIVRYAEEHSEPGDGVIIMILTDGYENASTEIRTADEVKALIERKEKDGWTFGYLGANDNPWAVAASIGIRGTNTVYYAASPIGTQTAFGQMSTASSLYSSSVSSQATAGEGPQAITDIFTVDDTPKPDPS